jgi:hypothetical protein
MVLARDKTISLFSVSLSKKVETETAEVQTILGSNFVVCTLYGYMLPYFVCLFLHVSQPKGS